MYNEKKNRTCQRSTFARTVELKSKVFLTGCTVPVVTSYVTKINKIRSSMIGHFFETIIVAATDKNLSTDPSKCMRWQMLKTNTSHLKMHPSHLSISLKFTIVEPI